MPGIAFFRQPGVVLLGMFDDGRGCSELFRELLRLLPSVEVGDYCKNGQWDKECLLIDIELVETNRQEARAPDPPPLEDVQEGQVHTTPDASIHSARPLLDRWLPNAVKRSFPASNVVPRQPSGPPPEHLLSRPMHPHPTPPGCPPPAHLLSRPVPPLPVKTEHQG